MHTKYDFIPVKFIEVSIMKLSAQNSISLQPYIFKCLLRNYEK